jgi:phosphoglycolate phosphatase
VIVLFWDIDGTLLSTGRAGVFALEDACLEVTGSGVDLDTLKTAGLTDHQIAVRILEHAGTRAEPDAVERFVRHYEERLPARLPLRQGQVLPGVREILQHLQETRPDVHSLLLTGNTAAGARAKLAHYGLQEFFDGGAFSEDDGPRSGIAVRALELVRSRFPDAGIERDRLFVVGDTPHDVDCAAAIGARTIAVATGGYPAADLTAHGAWRVFERLPDPLEFELLLDQAAAPTLSPR